MKKAILLTILVISLMSCTKEQEQINQIQATYTGSLKTFHDLKINGVKHAAYDPHIVESGSTILVGSKPYFEGETISLTVQLNGEVVFYQECECKIRYEFVVQ